MRTRKLGNTGLEVSAIDLGCIGMNHHRGPAPDQKEMVALVRSIKTAPSLVRRRRFCVGCGDLQPPRPTFDQGVHLI